MQQSSQNEGAQEDQQISTMKKPVDDSNTILVPKFISGLKSTVNNNIIFIDDQTVCYPVGHNVVLYNLEEKTQRYISGIEGSDGITALAVTRNKKYLAVAEKTSKYPICTIYDLTTPNLRRKKFITSNDIKSKEFISIAFSPNNQGLLVTLTSDPHQTVYIWSWEKAKQIGQQTLANSSPNVSGNQVSFSNTDEKVVLVTGNNTYRYFKMQDSNTLKQQYSQLNKKEHSHISNNYTAHCWLPEGKFLVGTDQGDIILCDADGQFKLILQQDVPLDGFYIQGMRIYTKGFIVAGSKGQILIYEKTDEPKQPYNRVAILPANATLSKKTPAALMQQMCAGPIKSIDLSNTEDTVIFSTDNSQLFKMSINLERPTDEVVYDYLVHPFHSRPINGMDVCIKKPFIVTCSSDRTVKVWSYRNQGSSTLSGFNLEVDQSFSEEANSVAFHPSGYHIVVGFSDRIRMMNLFEKSLSSYKDLPVKACSEIVFSNGGHLFACQNSISIYVYKFYLPENPIIFKAHSSLVSSISWFADDTGFVSSGIDANIFVWKLKTETHVPSWEYKMKSVTFSCVTTYKAEGSNNLLIYTTGSDKTIREICESSGGQGKETLRYEQSVVLSQIAVMHNRKAFFCGLSEQNRPGAIQVLKYPYEMTHQLEVHALPVKRLRVSYDNQTLFSCSNDGTFAVLSIQEKDQRKKDKDLPTIQYSDFILIQQAERNNILQEIELLNEKIKQRKKQSAEQAENIRLQKELRIAELDVQIKDKKTENQNQYELLESLKEEREREYQERIALMLEEHVFELDKRANDQLAKVEADKERLTDLEMKKDKQYAQFQKNMTEIYQTHTTKIEKMLRDHQLEKDELEHTKKTLSHEIESMITRHKQTREQVEQEIWDTIDKIKEDQKEELARVIDNGMKQQSDQTLINNEYKQQKSQKEALKNEITDMQSELNRKINEASSNRQTISSQKNELAERQTTIREKDVRIDELKQKTQELEKFKFVLDYKIKELKKDIKPNAEQILSLKEQTTKMNQEVQHFKRVRQNLKLIVNDLKEKMKGLEVASKDLRTQIVAQQAYKRQFQDDIYELLSQITHYKKLKLGIVRLYKKYMPETELSTANSSAAESDIHKENTSKRKHLETNLQYVTVTLEKNSTFHTQQNNKIMKENVTLIQEINSLKKEKHKLNLQIRELKVPDQTQPQGGEEYESDEIYQLRQENEELQDEIIQLEQRDREITEEIIQMTQSAELQLREQSKQTTQERDTSGVMTQEQPRNNANYSDELGDVTQNDAAPVESSHEEERPVTVE